MANRYAGTPLSSQWDAVQRRRALNQALMEQALASSGGTQMVSGGAGGPTQAVPYSIGTGIEKLGKALMARRGEKKAAAEEAEIAEKFDTNRQRAIETMVGKLQGTPTPYNLSRDEQFDDEQIPGLQNAAQAPDRTDALIEGGTNPYLQSTGMQSVMAALAAPKPKQSHKVVEVPLEGGKLQKQWYTDTVPGDRIGVPFNESDPSTNVTTNITNPENLATIADAANKKYGAGLGDNVIKRSEVADSARTQNVLLDRALLSIGRGAASGKGRETILALQSFAQTAGLDIGDPEKMGEEQMLNKIGNEMALMMRSPASGAGLPGSTSNQDLIFLKAAVLGLSKTKTGNIKIIELMKRQNQMKTAIADEQDRLIIQNGGSVPIDIESKLRAYGASYKFFNEGEREEIEALLAGSSTGKPKLNISAEKEAGFEARFKSETGP